MPDEDPKEAENKTNRVAIERVEASERVARGNVHSEPDENERPADGPPPLPN